MLFMVVLATIVLPNFPALSASQLDNANLPLTYPAKVIHTEQVCPPNKVQVSEQNEVAQDIQDLLDTVIMPSLCQVFQTQSSPAASCSALPTSCPSGYYWVRSSNGSAVQVYCDMERVCGCNNTGGWTRVAYLNMTDPNQQCPGAWMLQNYTTEPRRLCGNRIRYGCLSATFNTYGISYSQVCGRIIGYQFASPDAFYLFDTTARSIESYYVDGVSLTRGPPGARQHIWSFAAAFREITGSYTCCLCPCANRNTRTAPIPSFVGNDFFCESGNEATTVNDIPGVLYGSDPLWDSQGCGSPPCCELSYPPGVTAPWFCKQLPQTTTDDIEARICNEPEAGQGDDTQVQIVELYIR